MVSDMEAKEKVPPVKTSRLAMSVLAVAIVSTALLVFQLTSYTLLVFRSPHILPSLVDGNQILSSIKLLSYAAAIPIVAAMAGFRLGLPKWLAITCIVTAALCLLYGFFLIYFIRSML